MTASSNNIQTDFKKKYFEIYRDLNQNVDFDAIDFELALDLLRVFLRDVVLSPEWSSKFHVSAEVKDQVEYCILACQNYIDGSFSAEQERRANLIWSYCDELKGADRDMLRLAVVCLSKKELAMFDEYGASLFFDSVISTCYSLGGDRLCERLAEFVINCPRTPKRG
ncbi:hypothetical protein LJR129_000663 [Acidovorax sp. LjRoot129]|uniref:hypothetical protein n=1 Tax=Acidovorax sp. LjRoot129 TaxID=3342260 RepID=UPI003ECF60E2